MLASLASSSAVIDAKDIVFLLACETFPSITRPLRISLGSKQKRVIGSKTPELHWALDGVQECSPRQCEVEVVEEGSTKGSHCPPFVAVHPSVTHLSLVLRCIGQYPVYLQRFFDGSLEVVQPGEAISLKAYDALVIGGGRNVNGIFSQSPAMNCVLRLCVLRMERRKGVGTSAGPSVCIGSNKTSSMTIDESLQRIPSGLYMEDSPRLLVSSSQILELMLNDVVHHREMRQAFQLQVPVAAKEVDVVRYSPKLLSHVSDTSEDDIHILSARSRKIHCEPDASNVAVGGQAKPSQHSPSASAKEICSNNKKRERSTEGCTARAPSESNPRRTRNAPSSVGYVEGSDDECDVVEDFSRAHVPHALSQAAVVITPSQSSPSSVHHESYQESFEERWDEQLLALEARSAAIHKSGTVLKSPSRLTAASVVSVVGNAGPHHFTPAVTGSASLVRHSSAQIDVMKVKPRAIMAESQMVCFDHED